MKVRNIMHSLSILLLSSSAFAQKNLSEQVNVVRAYKPILAEAVKINSNAEIKFEQEGKTTPEYHFLSHRIDSNLKLNAVAVEKMKNESIAKFYRYYIRMAGGNYRSSYLEAWANNLRSKASGVLISSGHLINTCSIQGSTDNAVLPIPFVFTGTLR